MRAFYALVVTVLGISLFAGAAQADTRADVQDRAAHCSILPQGRLWLECFYGAAQPLRAAIGLPPAPQAQQFQQIYGQPMPPNSSLGVQATRDNSSTFFGIFGSKDAPPPVAANPTELRATVLRRALHCGVLPEGRLWLDCYYGAAQPLRASLGLAAAPQAVEYAQLYTQPLPGEAGASLRDPDDDVPGLFDIFTSPKVPVEQFGLKGARPGPGINVDRVVDKIVNVEATPKGAVVSLANGQVWRQTDEKQIVWRKNGTTYNAIITHGAFDGFNLHIQQGRTLLNDIYKVVRIR